MQPNDAARAQWHQVESSNNNLLVSRRSIGILTISLSDYHHTPFPEETSELLTTQWIQYTVDPTTSWDPAHHLEELKRLNAIAFFVTRDNPHFRTWNEHDANYYIFTIDSITGWISQITLGYFSEWLEDNREMNMSYLITTQNEGHMLSFRSIPTFLARLLCQVNILYNLPCIISNEPIPEFWHLIVQNIQQSRRILP